MIFETKFGLGEIVHYCRLGHKSAQHDEFLEVIAITFDKNAVTYFCRYPLGLVAAFVESDLSGDPDFDQEVGAYDYDLAEELG